MSRNGSHEQGNAMRSGYLRGVRQAWPLALLLVMGATQAVTATPDWLRAAAASPLPKYPDDTTAIVLFSEQATTVADSGEIRTLHRMAYKILRPQGREYGTVQVPFDKETRLTYLKAWCIPVDGRDYEVKERDAVDVGDFDDFVFYQDDRHKLLKIPASEPGNVIGYEYEQRRRPYILQDDWSFQREIPVLRARFELRLPKGWEFESFWLNHAPEKPQTPSNTEWDWELDNIAAIEDEPEMPPFEAVAGRLGVTYYARGGSGTDKSPASWNGIGRWYAQLAADRRLATPEIKQKVTELTSASARVPTVPQAASSAPPAIQPPTASSMTTWEKMEALASFVQKDVRYVAIEIGIGGIQPHYAGEIFSNRYGDCKDKATLLSTMLHEIGVESYYVLIDTNRGVVSPDFPFYGFNHVILAVRPPSDAPKDGLWATMDHPRLGRLLFFDPTDSMTPIGYLPTELQANYGLLIRDEGGELVKLPLIAPALNRVLRSAKLTLTPEGHLYGDVQELRWGYPAEDLRADLLKAPEADRSKMMESFLSSSLSTVSLQDLKVENLDDPRQTLVLRYHFSARDYAKSAGDLLLVRPRVLGHKGGEVLEAAFDRKAGERKYPVEFPAASVQSDIFEITLPDGYGVDELPPEVNADTGTAKYRSQTKVTGHVLTYTRFYQVNDVLVPAGRLGELGKFYHQIVADESSSAVLKKQATALPGEPR
jgi:transglutaminase-like putative cysteine protease